MTFSAIAVSPDRARIGIASASYSLAVGRSVQAIAPGVGGIITQAWTNRRFRARGLELLRAGLDPDEVIRTFQQEDADFASRQVAVMTPDGSAAHWTGPETTPWGGALAGENYTVIGNLLPGPAVLDEMAHAIEERRGKPLAELLFEALLAGQRAGGDRRGQQSATIVIANNSEADVAPPELEIDLRCDDSPAPLIELERMLQIQHAQSLAGA